MDTAIISEPRLRIFTWNVDESYLYYLSQGNYDIYVPYDPDSVENNKGRGDRFPFGANVIEVQVDEVRHGDFDLLLYQSYESYAHEQYELLSRAQRDLPKIFLEHNPPLQNGSLHPVQDRAVTLVHVTAFNNVNWYSALPDVRTIHHGVMPMPHLYQGAVDSGIAVLNGTVERSEERRLVEDVAAQVPLDVIGSGTECFGIGDMLHFRVPHFICQYRFLFNPIAHSSLSLSVCEAMMIGMPIISRSTTELASVIRNGENGYVHHSIDFLLDKMNFLLQFPALAAEMGAEARHTAMQLFHLDRFVKEWERLFYEKVNTMRMHR